MKKLSSLVMLLCCSSLVGCSQRPHGQALDASSRDGPLVEMDAVLPGIDVASDITPLLLDDALSVDSVFPRGLLPGESGRIHLWFMNVGSATWSQASGYRVSAVGGSDPLFGPVYEIGEEVVPTSSVLHAILYVFAPGALGTYTSDWQMDHAGVQAFGPIISGDVLVMPDPALCPPPVPPPMDKLSVVIHNDQGWKKVLDSTPLVWADGGVFCAEIGFTDNRRHCPPRPEGHPEVDVCNEQVVGRAPDTGRVGPLWTYNGLPCIDEAQDGRCRNHGTNQFLVFVFGPGHARACGRNGVCGEIDVP